MSDKITVEDAITTIENTIKCLIEYRTYQKEHLIAGDGSLIQWRAGKIAGFNTAIDLLEGDIRRLTHT